jgi:hypothetical protein
MMRSYEGCGIGSGEIFWRRGGIKRKNFGKKSWRIFSEKT